MSDLLSALGYKSGERDSTCDTKPLEVLQNELRQQNNTNNNNNDYLSLSDEELRYIIDTTSHEEYPLLIEQILELFRKYRFFYSLILCSEMILFWCLMFTTWEKRESSITVMEEVYRDLNSKEAAFLFYLFFYFSLTLNLFYYPYGFYSLAKKNVRSMKFYTHFTLLISIMTIIMIYINILFIFAFVFRLIMYGFSRFLANLLVSILLIPRQNLANNNANTNYNSI